MVLMSPAHGEIWVGNDNGEFTVSGSSSPTYVGLYERFNDAMTWSSSPPYNRVSMQYNPDYVISLSLQYLAEWFQAVIWIDSNGCGGFSVQLWSLIVPLTVWRDDQSFSTCSNGSLSNSAAWYIREDFVSSSDLHITAVYFHR